MRWSVKDILPGGVYDTRSLSNEMHQKLWRPVVDTLNRIRTQLQADLEMKAKFPVAIQMLFRIQ